MQLAIAGLKFHNFVSEQFVSETFAPSTANNIGNVMQFTELV